MRSPFVGTIRPWIVEIHTILGVKKKGVLARSPEEAKMEIARLQITTNFIDIAYVPRGEIGDAYELPLNKPLPPCVPMKAYPFIMRD